MNAFAQIPVDLYITSELHKRVATPADYLREKSAIQELAASMVERPEKMLPRFVDLAMALTGAVSAGLSLFEPFPAPGVFRWRHLRGSLSAFEGAVTPRDFSPCGVTLDANAPVLSLHPERFYQWISDAGIVVPEVLLVPFYVNGAEPMGTLWIVAGSEGHFHADHARIATELASFVGMAFKMLRTEHRLQAALEEQETLTKEMSHRIKNLFAVSGAMVRMALKSANSREEMAQLLTGRFHALAGAHGMVRRSFSAEGTPPEVCDLVELLHIVLKPHDRDVDQESKFSIVGPALACGEHALNGIALMFHELATNALKYGALAAEEGRVDILWTVASERVEFIWKESGGPAIKGKPETSGFGSKLLSDTVEFQFNGSMSHHWHRAGLVVEIDIPMTRLAY